MKKIAIITMTGGTNFGNRLQNYATQEIVKNFHFDVETIRRMTEKKDISLVGIEKRKKSKYSFSNIKNVVISKLNYKFDIKNNNIILAIILFQIKKNKIKQSIQRRKEAFVNFNKQFIVQSNFFIGKENIQNHRLEKYDYFICGSDQIWNPNFSQTSLVDFLAFAPENKRISFSASFGVDRIPEAKKDQFQNWLNGIPSLSVREQKGADIIYEITGRRAKVLIDPTLLLDEKKWLEISKNPINHGENPYLLSFFLGVKNKKYQSFISKASKVLSLKIVNLCDINDYSYYGIGPCEFIYLIKNATLICTDSFHGTAFSILMKRNFVSFDRIEGSITFKRNEKSMVSRIEHLLQIFHLETRFFQDFNWENLVKTDYSSVDTILDRERMKANCFLKEAFSIKENEF